MKNKVQRRSFVTGAAVGSIAAFMGSSTALNVEAVESEKKMSAERPTPPGPDPTHEQLMAHLRHANKVAQAAAARGLHPFGAILVDSDHTTVVMEQGNVSSVNHAESTLARLASERFTADELWGMTLYSTVEPCAMCAGTQYWANIGRLVYGINESQLLEFTGASSENPTMDVPCRYIFEHSQKAIKVWGPVTEVASEIAALHLDFWK